MKYLLAFIAIMLVATPVMAEITYSEQFYENQNKSRDATDRGTIGSFTAAQVYEQRITNELLIKQNNLLQEQNNLTATQNEILRRFYWFIGTYYGPYSSGFVRPQPPLEI